MVSKKNKLTKQGVRDLGNNYRKKRNWMIDQCEHKNFNECCKGCKHYHCLDCGFSWDEAIELHYRY